ncbi:MAG: Ig-like domain-containing protein [Kofleriaceae bacterium]
MTATDRGNAAPTVTRTFTVDNTPPAISLTAPAEGSFVRGVQTLSFAATDANPGVTVTATLDGTPLASGQTVSAEGAHTVVVNATDAAGNAAATVTRHFTIDNTPPVLTVTAPASGAYVRGPVNITFSATDNFPPVTLTATLDGNPVTSPVPAINTEGSHTLVVTATDRAGNAAPTVTRTFTVDNTPPAISLTAPAEGSFVRGVQTSFAATDANPGVTATATLDGSPLASGQTVSAEGAHTVVVNATDAAGNAAATVTRHFTIDNTPPAITVTGVVNGGAYGANVAPTFFATDAYTASPTVTATLNGSPYASGVTISVDGTYTLVVSATDAAGNTATTTLTFLLDKGPPVLSLTAQVPTGSYVRGMLSFTVTGDDFLAAGGSLASDIAVAATLSGSPVTPGLSYPVLSAGRRQVVATFPAGSLADGTLRLTFTLVDRAGNAAAPLVVQVIVDNTAPTGLAITGIDTSGGDRQFFDGAAAPPTRWVNTATPTLLGTFTEANPGATVQVAVGAGTVAGTTLTTTTWRGAVPTGSVTGGGVDATVTVTDAAGNVATVSQRLRVDATRPTVDSPTSVTVRDEAGAGETITLVATPTPHWNHVHGGATVSLGGNVVTCPELHKYAYLTDAAPEATEGAPNPITFNWQASDAGVGVDTTTLRFFVRTPGGATRGPYAVTPTSGTPTSFNYTTPLYRNVDAGLGVPELGVPGVTEEGTFYVDVYADDRLGNTSLVGSRCWTHRPRGVPVQATAPAQLTSNFYGDALTNYQLSANDVISTLLNGTHPGAGFMTYQVKNITSDDVWMSFTPSASVTYSKDWRTHNTVTSTATASITCTWDGVEFIGDARCPGDPSSTLAGQAGSGTAAVPAGDLSVRLWEQLSASSFIEQTACTATPACAGRFRLAAGKTYQVVVGAKKIAALQQTGVGAGYQEASRTDDPGVYSSAPPTATITRVGASKNRTGTAPQALPASGPGVDQACDRWTLISGQSYRCNRVATFQGVRYLYSASATFQLVNATGSASAGGSLGAASENAGAISGSSNLPQSTTWTTTEN